MPLKLQKKPMRSMSLLTVEPEGPQEVPEPLVTTKPHKVPEVQVRHDPQDS